ncbi:MAG: response regulator, partial [Desulfobacterales bacterium]|nr:response regulator [Desulfobacterales bacterium]
MENRFKILAVDDSLNTLEVIQRNLTPEGYKVFTVSSVNEAVNILETHPIDLVITDLKMPRVGGLDLIRHVRENLRDVEIMMITGYPSIEGAVEAVKSGAEEYLVKPFTDKELLSAVQRMLEKLVWRRTSQSKNPLNNSYGIIGDSKEMQDVFKQMKKAASTDAT